MIGVSVLMEGCFRGRVAVGQRQLRAPLAGLLLRKGEKAGEEVDSPTYSCIHLEHLGTLEVWQGRVVALGVQ